MKSSVKIEIYGNRERYWGYVRFTDSEGTEHVRTAAGKREDSLKSNTLQALIECLKLLIRPCMVDVYTKMDEIIEPFKQGWIYNWEKNDWTNAAAEGFCYFFHDELSPSVSYCAFTAPVSPA